MDSLSNEEFKRIIKPRQPEYLGYRIYMWIKRILFHTPEYMKQKALPPHIDK